MLVEFGDVFHETEILLDHALILRLTINVSKEEKTDGLDAIAFHIK